MEKRAITALAAATAGSYRCVVLARSAVPRWGRDTSPMGGSGNTVSMIESSHNTHSGHFF